MVVFADRELTLPTTVWPCGVPAEPPGETVTSGQQPAQGDGVPSGAPGADAPAGADYPAPPAARPTARPGRRPAGSGNTPAAGRACPGRLR